MSKNIDDIALERRHLMKSGGVALGLIGMATAATVNASTASPSTSTQSTLFNVLDFGAEPVEDPSNMSAGFDSTDAFKAAIAAASNAITSPLWNSHNGGVVYIPRGTYKISETLLIQTSNIQIVGEGKAVSTLYGYGVDGAIVAFNSSYEDPQLQNCSIQGVAFYGSSVPVAADYCVVMKNVTKSTVRDVTFASKVNVAALLVENSWVNNFFDLHFIGHSPTAHLYINRPLGCASSNALNFYGCNFTAGQTEVGVLIESNSPGSTVGEGLNFNGATFQGFNKAFFARHGECINITSYYGEDNETDIQLGDNTSGAAFVRNISITSWRCLRGKNGLVLEQCREVNVGSGYAKYVDNPIVIGEGTGVSIMSGRNMTDYVKYAPNARKRTGVMVFDGDRHDSPDWPAVPTPMGIVMKTDSSTKGKHFKITVDDQGNLKTTEVSFENQS
ncbi:glycosyl hydrolase family 28-related protein [Aliiglaciecola litoralis]|uniref:Rhamnogalacturonase A/B/Epimerase-like pectate lyase domain-containing protein n=1 Tax=Aliiglaciecola litoralis TaxID=582857 RepID=A0ABP3X2G6_9ALTE